MIKTIINFSLSVIISALGISIISSQIILAEIQGFGLDVSASQRLSVTIQDLLGLTPGLFILLTPSFMIAFIISKYVQPILGGKRTFWLSFAGLCSFPCTLYLIQYFMGITILASARTNSGMLIIALCCATGGLLYAKLSTKSEGSSNV